MSSPQFYSQYNQDQYLDEHVFFAMRDGFFVEVGADDGVRFSNTLFFETDRDWSGILVEPKKGIFNDLCRNRPRSVCLNCAVSDIPSEYVDFLEIEGYGRQLSGIVANYDNRHLERINRETENLSPANHKKQAVKVRNQTLDDIFVKYNVSHVDLLSIDTEGSEISVLRSSINSLDRVKVILLENNYDHDHQKLFAEIAPSFRLKHRIQHDEIFVNHKLM